MVLHKPGKGSPHGCRIAACYKVAQRVRSVWFPIHITHNTTVQIVLFDQFLDINSVEATRLILDSKIDLINQILPNSFGFSHTLTVLLKEIGVKMKSFDFISISIDLNVSHTQSEDQRNNCQKCHIFHQYII